MEDGIKNYHICIARGIWTSVVRWFFWVFLFVGFFFVGDGFFCLVLGFFDFFGRGVFFLLLLLFCLV